MSISDEREALYTAANAPERQHTPGYCVHLFTSTARRKIAEAISAATEDKPGHPIDVKEVEQRSGLTVESVAAEFSGCRVLSEEGFRLTVNALIREQQTAKLNLLLADEARTNLKTGTWDEKKQSRIRELVRELDEIEKPAVPTCLPLSNIQAKSISWLWPGRIPLGMLTLIAGDPGLGKSFLSLWIASRFSRGEKFPDAGAPAISGGTIYLSAEDSAAFVLRPRADANLADSSRIYVMEDPSLDIDEDLKRIRAQLDADPTIKLLFIDPLNSFLGQVDYFKDTAVRAALAPLCRLLEEREVAGVGVMHLNKKVDLGGIYRIGGSIAFAGVARSIMAVTQHPEDEDRRLLRPIKMNYAKRPAALAFHIDDDLRLTFDLDPVIIDDDEALSPKITAAGADNSFANEWLRERLAGEGEELKALIRAAADVGISRRTLFYVKNKVGIVTHASGFGKNKISVWELPR